MKFPPLPLLTLGCLLLALAGQPALAARPLVYCADASPEGFDPSLWDSASTHNVTTQMFEGLLAFERGSSRLVPALAQSWQISPDARTVEFHLRPGVHFHTEPYFTPTRDFNADDVLFTFGRMIDKQHPFNQAFPATFVYPENLGLAQMVERIEKVDAMTVRFHLTRPNVSFQNYFAMGFAGIHSAEYGAQLLRQGRAKQINNQPIGTGPYQFKSYAKDDVVRMQPHPGYWGGRQASPGLIYSITTEPNVRVQKLLAGECQVSAPIRDVDIAAIQRRPDIRLMQTQALNVSYLSFNLRKAPTNNRLVREALDIAVDRDTLFKVLFPRGDATQAVSAFPPMVPGYNRTLKNEYNPTRAKALLAQAGYAQGMDIDLWALPVSRPTNPNGQLLAQLIQADWARIGVRAHIKTYEWGEYLKRANNGEHDVYMSGWSGDTADPDDFLSPNLSCAANRSGVKFCNPDFDRLLDQARATPDATRRAALYEQAQLIFHHERPWIPIAHSTVYIPVRQGVTGFVMSPDGSVDFKDVVRQ
ncbi:ABC transporter substrate-binding protein [Ideonella oryzae]|uniref:ABC transporter substrate-binding protein n=1 Tax=Ideonella oryzae TaxID=2937441 RepID=A0ABT1BIS4_9BURK|nr:ABC transporter substrate-binding protein [Ideonella oryzae]MCO5975327.1 ABC transporter substrate-binding protein [Ideonella oryzae]